MTDVVGPALVLDEPLSLWGGMDPATGELIDARHPQRGARLTGRVVVMPSARGSSSRKQRKSSQGQKAEYHQRYLHDPQWNRDRKGLSIEPLDL